MKRFLALGALLVAAPAHAQSPVIHLRLSCTAPTAHTACRVVRITDSTPTGGAVVLSHPVDVAAGAAPWTMDFPCSPSVNTRATAWVVGVRDGKVAADTGILQSNIVTCQRYLPAAPTVTFAVNIPEAGPTGAPPSAAEQAHPVTHGDSLPPHPRVWLDPARLARLRRQVAANTIRWQRVQAAADAQVARGSAYGNHDYFLLPDLCLAYLGTGQQRYATRAGVLIRRFATDSNTDQGDSGYGYRYDLPVVTMGLDWCFNGLTPGERHQAATWLMNRADWIWPETNDGGYRYSINNPADNYFWGFMQTGPAALAALGSDTARGAKSGTNRPAFHIALALHKWATIGKPYLDGPGHGGAYIEGSNYDQGWKIGAFADAFLTAGDTLSDPWFADALQWHLQYVLPDLRHKLPTGAQTRVSDAPIYTYDREHLFHLLDPARASPATRALVQAELNAIGQVPLSELGSTSNLADELLYYDPAQPAAANLSALPRTFLSDSTGVFVSRTSWTDPDALVWYFQSGPADNDNYGSNHLAIWQGSSWITAKAAIYSGPGSGYPSEMYNTLTVGDTGSQRLGPGANHGRIVALQRSESLIAIRGQADSAYGTANEWVRNRPVTDYLRTVAYLPDLAAFVVVDQAAFVDSTIAPVYWWQSAHPLTVSDTGFALVNKSGDHRCDVSLLAPKVMVRDTAFDLGGNKTPTSYAAVIRTAPRRINRAVTVLQCGATGFSPKPARAVLAADRATVTIGSVRVVVPFAVDGKVVRQ